VTSVYWEPTRTVYNVEKEKVLLYSLLEQGAPVQFECQFGHCRKCLVHVKDGHVQHQDVPAITKEEQQAGYLLLCSSKPNSDSLSINLVRYD